MPRDRPSIFVFEVAPPFAPTTRVELQSGSLVVSRLSQASNEQEAERHKARVPHGDWSMFLRAIDFLDVWNWKPRYAPQDIGYEVKDGQYWQVALAFKERSVRTKGHSAYPAFESPSVTSLQQERFGLFVYCLGELIAHEWSLTTPGKTRALAK